MLLDSALVPVARCRLLSELIQFGVQPINVAALQLLRTTLDTVMDSDIAGLLSELVACLLQVSDVIFAQASNVGCEHNVSHSRLK